MKWTTLALLALPGGLLLAACWWLWTLRRDAYEAARTDLVPRWKTFMESAAPEGEPTIEPLALPVVRPLTAVRLQEWKTRRFRQGRR